ncbi:MAG: phosphoesterase [Francisellaceae bacterium]|nr:phosphoesterase [Francisellaceae bacterium]
MPDLHIDAVNAFWDSYDRRTLYRIIAALENVEHWTVDTHPEIDPYIIALGDAIDNAHDFEIDEKIMIRILSNTHAGRALRILQAIDMAKPGTASQLLMYAEEASQESGNKPVNQHAKIFLRRNLVFERLQLLSRVFSPQRVSLVLKALEQENE